MNDNAFQPFGKISRLSREMVITEKCDGTNAQIFIWDPATQPPIEGSIRIPWIVNTMEGNMSFIAAGSRNRWLTLTDDNFGFAKWVHANASELAALGPGRHYGEWWGSGIQRNYGLVEKRFSLFNVDRWRGALHAVAAYQGDQKKCPDCCHVVPVLYRGEFDTGVINQVLQKLSVLGSVAAPGFMHPEGIVIYHTASRTMFKKTVEHDKVPKTSNKIIPITFHD